MEQRLYNQAPKAFNIRLKRPLNKLNSLQKESNEDQKIERKKIISNTMINKLENQKTIEITEDTIRSSKLFQSSLLLTKKYKKKITKLQNQGVEKEQENKRLQQQIKHYQDVKRKQLKKILKLLKEKAELQEYITILQDQLHQRFQEDENQDYVDDFDNESQINIPTEILENLSHTENNEPQEDLFQRTFLLHQERINQFRNFIQQLQQNQLQLFPLSVDFTDINPDSMTYEQLLELQDRIGYVNKGLTEEEINKIPIIDYKPNEELDQNICAICQCQWEQGDQLKTLNCHHNYHPQCIDEWLSKNKHCPVCIQEVSP